MYMFFCKVICATCTASVSAVIVITCVFYWLDIPPGTVVISNKVFNAYLKSEHVTVSSFIALMLLIIY